MVNKDFFSYCGARITGRTAAC